MQFELYMICILQKSKCFTIYKYYLFIKYINKLLKTIKLLDKLV